MRIRKYFLPLFIFILLLAPQSSLAEKIRAVASFSIIGDMIENVGGEFVEVRTLVGPNQNAHIYEPSPEDVMAIANADIVFINGLGFEGWLERLIYTAQYNGKTITISEGAKKRKIGDKGEDPHAWQSLANGEIYIRNIAKALSEMDSDNADYYNKNAEYYISKLRTLHKNIKDQFAALSPEKRKAVTSHESFGYFGDEYGIEFLSPAGFNSESEPTPTAVIKLIKHMKQNKIRALFVENIMSTKIIEQIQFEGGGVIAGVLYSDTLSQPGGPADSYLKMVQYNAKTIYDAINTAQ